MITARDHVDHLAELDAIAFVEAFGRPVEDSESDREWIADAWRRAAEDAGLNEGEVTALSRRYREALRQEIAEQLRAG